MPTLYDPILQCRAFGCARQGASHQATETRTPCQDAHLIQNGSLAGRPFVLIAVADGHGSARYDRSAVGAQLAVEASARNLIGLLRQSGSDDPGRLARAFKQDFPQRLVRTWREEVLRHAETQMPAPPPLQPDSTTMTGDPAGREAMIQRYGTTLIMAAQVERTLLLSQLGDGDLLLWHHGVQEPEALWGAGENLVGGETFSLASAEASRLMRATSRDCEGIRAVTLTTDGVANAYEAPSRFHAMLRAVLENVDEYGTMKTANILPDYLDRFSLAGSGDDMTLAVMLLA